MAHTVNSFLAAPFVLPTFTFKITVAGTPHTVTGGGSSLYVRSYLARASGTSTGTVTDPHELGAYIKGRIDTAVGGTDTTVRMRTDARWEITHAGGTWSILWDGTSSTDKIVRDALGYSGNIAATASGTYSAAAYVAYQCVAGMCRAENTGYQPSMQSAGAKLPDGSRYGFSSGYVEWSSRASWRFFPIDSATATSYGDKHSFAVGPTTRWKQPTVETLGNLTGGWSVADFLFSVDGLELGHAPGTFQNLVSGGSATYDAVYLDPASRNPDNWTPTTLNWSGRRDVKGWILDWYAAESRS